MGERYDRLVGLLEGILAELRKQNASMERTEGSHLPWAFQLVLEFNTGSDTDSNGMILGKDFSLAENFNHIPPALQPIIATLQRDRWPGKLITWDEYLGSLKPGTYKDQVAAFVGALPPRPKVTSAQAEAAKQGG